MKYLYAFAVRGGFILSLLFFSLLAQAQTQPQENNPNLLKKSVDKLTKQTATASNLPNKEAMTNVQSLNHLKSEPVNKTNLKNTDIVKDNNASPFDNLKGKEEDVSKRDAFAKHFPNEDGSYTAVIAAGPVHYQKNGKWEDINTSIIKINHPNYPFSNTANLMESRFGKTSHLGVISKTEKGEVKEFLNTKMYWELNGQKVGLQNGKNVVGVSKENKLYYYNLFEGIDAEFKVLTGKRKLNYIIQSKESLGEIPAEAEFLVFSEDIVLPVGWTYKMNNFKNVEILNLNGEVAFTYQNPYMIENYKEGEPPIFNMENPTSVELKEIKNGFSFIIKIKTSWLKSNERVYPIALDPTVSPDNAAMWTGSVRKDGLGQDDIMYVGRDANLEVDSWVRFNLTTIPDNSIIASAYSKYYLIDKTTHANFNNRYFTLGDCIQDPLTATFYSEIFDGYTQNISTSVPIYTDPATGWRDSGYLTEVGMSYIQNSLPNDFATIILWPSWTTVGVYALFEGYSETYGGKRPELIVTYTNTCISPTSPNSNYKLTNVSFVGTLNPDTNNATDYSNSGYGNFKGLPNKAKQIPGGVINVKVKTPQSTHIKAWVDWNNDGLFDETEKVFDTGTLITSSTIFGFVVPAGTVTGDYNIRIRTHRDTWYYRACGPLSNGETEDYSFEVIADCSAKITAVNINPGDGVRCGSGSVQLSAIGTAGTTIYHWYSSEFGGSPIYSHPSGIYNTSDINLTTTLYVTASNGSCESVKRTPVVARIDPIPTIDFTQSESDICSDVASMSISSTGDKEEITLIDEKFNSGLGVFKNVIEGNTNNDANWINRNSPYVVSNPPYKVLSPAISSGYDGGKYAVAITDVQQTSNIIRYLELSNSVNASQLTNLKFDFNLYYQPFAIDNLNYSYFRIQASSDGGLNWITLQTITSTQGNPGNWSKQSLTLPSNYNTNNLKVRFVIFSYGASNGWVGDIAAVDNIRLYGDKPLDTTFAWNAPGMDVFNADCTTPYSGASTEVCIKPNENQIENYAVWDVTATATLSNGCDAVGLLQITNNNKVWNPDSATDWTSNAWKPSTSAPTADQCVIVKKNLQLPIGELGLAKNLIVKENASLTIQKDAGLTVTDFIHNEAGVDNFIVKSGGSLVQINDNAANTGKITAEREFNFSAERKQYNFIISPVKNQEIKSIYPGNPAPFVIKYVEGRNWFINAGLGTYIAGKGYSIKEQAGSGAETVTARLKGEPANGQISYPLQYATAPTQQGEQINGYNLVGNPYPSNLDLNQLYANNSGKIEATFQFWDNRGNENYTQQGSNYQGANYAKYNAVNGTGNGSGEAASGASLPARIPNKLARPGTAFMIRALEDANGKTLDFKNEYRVAANDSPEFFGKDSNESKNPSRYWLIMRTPSGIEYMTAVVYFWNGNNDFTLDDSEANGSSDDIYTLVGEEQIAIHGRAPFVKTDKVPLGVRLFEMGTYVISLYDKEGVFANGQNIYIRDKKLKTIYNLTQADYKFIEDAGEFNDRFEIIYLPHSFSADNASENASKIQIEKKDGNFVVTSEKDKITQVEVFALSGRSAFQKSEINNLEFKVPVNRFEKQIIVFVVETEKGEVITKKFVNK